MNEQYLERTLREIKEQSIETRECIQRLDKKVDINKTAFTSHIRHDEETYEQHINTLGKIASIVEHTRESLVKLDKKMDLHIQKTEMELEHIKELDERQNELLDEHSKRSDRLEKDNQLREASVKKEFEERFQNIEKPREWIKTTSKVLFYLASSAGALYGAYEFISAFIL